MCMHRAASWPVSKGTDWLLGPQASPARCQADPTGDGSACCSPTDPGQSGGACGGVPSTSLHPLYTLLQHC